MIINIRHKYTIVYGANKFVYTLFLDPKKFFEYVHKYAYIADLNVRDSKYSSNKIYATPDIEIFVPEIDEDDPSDLKFDSFSFEVQSPLGASSYEVSSEKDISVLLSDIRKTQRVIDTFDELGYAYYNCNGDASEALIRGNFPNDVNGKLRIGALNDVFDMSLSSFSEFYEEVRDLPRQVSLRRAYSYLHEMGYHEHDNDLNLEKSEYKDIFGFEVGGNQYLLEKYMCKCPNSPIYLFVTSAEKIWSDENRDFENEQEKRDFSNQLIEQIKNNTGLTVLDKLISPNVRTPIPPSVLSELDELGLVRLWYQRNK